MILKGPPICTLQLIMHIVFLCECMCLCLVLHLLYHFTGNLDLTPLTETFSFSVCALYPGLFLQIPGLCWDSSEDNVVLLRNAHKQAAPYKNDPRPLAQPPANASPNSLSKWTEPMGVLHALRVKKHKTILYVVPVNTCADLTAFLSICPDLCLNDISLTHWHSEHELNRGDTLQWVFST